MESIQGDRFGRTNGNDGDSNDEKLVCSGSAWSKNHFFLKQYNHAHANCPIPRSHPIDFREILKKVCLVTGNAKLPSFRVHPSTNLHHQYCSISYHYGGCLHKTRTIILH